MRKLIQLVGVIAILALAGNAVAQKKVTEGKIVYGITLSGDADGMMAAMMPTEMTMRFKGTKARTEMISSMSETVILTDSKVKNEGTILLDIMGSKYAMKMDEKSIKEQEDKLPKYDVKETTETKDIAGYKCKKAILTNTANKEEVIVYYTEEIPNMENTLTAQFKSLKGMPMEFTAKMNEVSMTLLVKSITKEKVEDAAFLVPSEYKVVTQEELMKEFGGGQ
jgi:GLPGLI family protein